MMMMIMCVCLYGCACVCEHMMQSSSIFNVVTPKGICRTGRVHVYFRCRRLCERVFTALWAIFRVQELRKKYLQCGMNMMENV